jgi:hypothetical protein
LQNAPAPQHIVNNGRLVTEAQDNEDDLAYLDLSQQCSVLGIDRTPNTEHRTAVMMDDMDGEALVVDALTQLGIQAAIAHGQGPDLVIEPVGTRVQVERRTLVTDDAAERLLAKTPLTPGSVLLVVGDRITKTARKLLTRHGAGYYDLRGHLALRSDSVVIDADVEPIFGPTERKHALSGSAGLEVATALLMAPASGTAVRQLARTLGRSPSTVSEVLAALRRDGLIDERHRVIGAQLFWQVADQWPVTRTYLTRLPAPGSDTTTTRPLRLGLDEAEKTTGWALTDSAAALAYGAPLAVRAGQLLDFYVPDQAILRRAVTLVGTASSRSDARCAVRVAPVPAACSHRVDLATSPFEWPLAHPLFVALDLAQDTGRGREILDAWTPPERWARVW